MSFTAKTLQEMQDDVKNLLKAADDVIGYSELETALQWALRIYSIDSPREVVLDKIGDGKTYEWDVPDDWRQGFSYLVQVEYPAGEAGETELQLLEDDDYEVVRTATATLKWRLKAAIPDAGEKARFTYTTLHVIDDESSTLNSCSAEFAVKLAAAHFAALIAKAHFAKQVPSNLLEDMTEGGAQVRYYQELADNFRNMSGLAHVITTGREAETPAGFRVLPVKPEWQYAGAGGWMTHRKVKISD